VAHEANVCFAQFGLPIPFPPGSAFGAGVGPISFPERSALRMGVPAVALPAGLAAVPPLVCFVLPLCSPAEVRQRVVPRVAVQVSAPHAFRTRADEGGQDENVEEEVVATHIVTEVKVRVAPRGVVRV
jgi:hypothetical protein